MSKLIILAALVVLAVLAGSANACHNVTGTCLSHGFVCANEQVVPHSQRCNGVEECEDGTDEFMCEHENSSPLHEREDHERHAFEQATCVNCACIANTLTITSSNSWYQFALVAPTDPAGLMTGSNSYGGLPCNSRCTTQLSIRFYKKTGVCRGFLCCARQMSCIACTSGGSCPTSNNPSSTTRCYKA